MKKQPELPAKMCYTHIGGKLGALLLEAFIEKHWLEKSPNSKHYVITAKGKKELAKFGIDLSMIEPEII